MALGACAHQSPHIHQIPDQSTKNTVVAPLPAANPPEIAPKTTPNTPPQTQNPDPKPVPQTDKQPELAPSAAPALDEVVRLYRRLHAELDADQRSGLITELLSDPRKPILDLGFELAHRNLSARTVLSPQVGDATAQLLTSPDPSIRGQAAGLLTRLVTPDAMLVLTESLNRETDPAAAESMLLGVARWPNTDAIDAVVRWSTRPNAPFDAVMTTAWAFEQAGLITAPDHRKHLLDALRTHDDADLSAAGMKLLSKLGDASDLKRLAALLGSDDDALRNRVANALVETPRATELLVQAAELDARLYTPASESLIRHRPTPAGLQRLAALQAPSESERQSTIDRMGDAMDIETLAEGVMLADLDDTTAARLLERLLSIQDDRSLRMAKGIVMLMEIELRRGRPNQALDIADSLIETVLDPITKAKFTTIHQQAAINAGALDHPALADTNADFWFKALDQAQDPESRQAIIAQIHKRFDADLTDAQQELLGVLNQDPEPADE